MPSDARRNHALRAQGKQATTSCNHASPTSFFYRFFMYNNTMNAEGAKDAPLVMVGVILKK